MGHSKTSILNLVVLFFLATYFLDIGLNGVDAARKKCSTLKSERCKDKSTCCLFVHHKQSYCSPLATNGSRCSKKKSDGSGDNFCPCQPGYVCEPRGPQGSRDKCYPA